jgi:hypothetical protein
MDIAERLARGPARAISASKVPINKFLKLVSNLVLPSRSAWALPFLVAAAVGGLCAAILFIVPIRPLVVDSQLPAGAPLRAQPH